MKNWLYTLSVALAVALTTPISQLAAADLGNGPGRQYVEAPVVSKDWTGVYGGFLIGWGSADFETNTSTTVDFNGSESEGYSYTVPFGFGSSGDAWNFGVQLGVDKQYGPFVFGAVADWSFMGLEGGGTTDIGQELQGTVADGFVAPGEAFLDHEFGIENLATARLRAGFLVNEWILAYGTVGVAFGTIEGDFRVRGEDVSGGSLNFSTDDQRWGWTVGAGLEAKLTENIRAKVEYLYVDLGEAEYNVNLLSPGGEVFSHSGSTAIDLHLVRAGLAYQF